MSKTLSILLALLLLVGGCDSGSSTVDGGQDAGAAHGGADGGPADGRPADGGPADRGARRCDGRVVDRAQGSPCGLDPNDCGEGLLCNTGCTDDLDDCSGICVPSDTENAFCRQGHCTPEGTCAAPATSCREDGFCYPNDF